MNKKTKYLFSIFGLSLLLLVCLVVVLQYDNTQEEIAIENKLLFTQMTTLPDIALGVDSSYIRHRSLNGVGSIFNNGPEHIESELSTFAISYR